MSEFVNYNKRSVTLPSGCKNLSDLLKGSPEGLHSLVGGTDLDLSKAIPRSEVIRGTLSEISTHVDWFWKSRALSSSLMVSPHNSQLQFNLEKIGQLDKSAHVSIIMGTSEENAVRKFFQRHGLQMPENSILPACFSPDLPVRLICDISPVPSEAWLLSVFVADLLHEVCGLKDDAELNFVHYELDNPH